MTLFRGSNEWPKSLAVLAGGRARFDGAAFHRLGQFTGTGGWFSLLNEMRRVADQESPGVPAGADRYLVAVIAAQMTLSKPD